MMTEREKNAMEKFGNSNGKDFRCFGAREREMPKSE